MLKIIMVLFLCCTITATAVAQPEQTQGLRPDTGALAAYTLVRGPYLQQATPNSITIRWRTILPTSTVLLYGLDKAALQSKASNNTSTTEHVVTLKNLQPSTTYYYAVADTTDKLIDKENIFSFKTMPPIGAPGVYKIGVFGDCGNNSTNQRNVRDQFINYLGDAHLNAWILLGDNAYYKGTDAEFQNHFFEIYRDNLLKKFALFPAPGNHDYKIKHNARKTHDIAYYKIFSMPQQGEAGGVASYSPSFYAFDVGNVHFISLDSYGKEKDNTRLFDTAGLQVQWLKKDLEAYQRKKDSWIVAYWHHPPYSMGTHNSDRKRDMKKIRKHLLPILERYGVDLVLGGHSHTYERSGLIKGHFGKEKRFDKERHQVSASSALYNGSANSCPYIKGKENEGTVYVVTGSAGALGGRQKSFPHKAMIYSNDSIGGASLIEVAENKLTFTWIGADGAVRDRFVMMKEAGKHSIIKINKGEAVQLKASYVGQYKWNHTNAATRSITVKPTANSIYKVKDEYSCIEDVFEVSVTN